MPFLAALTELIFPLNFVLGYMIPTYVIVYTISYEHERAGLACLLPPPPSKHLFKKLSTMESSDEAQLLTTDNERTTRHTWVKMKKSITKRDGQQVMTFPFLSDDNWQDKVMIRHLLAQRHYAAAHGDVGDSWNAVMEGSPRKPIQILACPSSVTVSI